MLPAKKRILVADPQVLNQASMIATLKAHYHVVTAQSAAEVQKKLKKTSVDMILLETTLADGDGFELCRQLKSDKQTGSIPIIFVTDRTDVNAEAKGFEVGAVDYITKPYTDPTIRARIKIQLKLSEAIKELKRLHYLALDANPNTGLPGNNSIMDELKKALDNDDPVTVIYADLDNFKIFNDLYGFAQGDNIIGFTANVIKVAMQIAGCGNAFLGHVGGDDFVIIVPSDKCTAVADEIISRIDRGIREFYSAEDLERGHVIATDREGMQKQYPFVSLSLGAVDLTCRKLTCPLEVIDVCTETKKAAKARQGSNLFLDQRRVE